MKLKHTDQTTRATTVLEPKAYNELVDYANETEIYNISTVLRQAVTLFLKQKTSKHKLVVSDISRNVRKSGKKSIPAMPVCTSEKS